MIHQFVLSVKPYRFSHLHGPPSKLPQTVFHS